MKNPCAFALCQNALTSESMIDLSIIGKIESGKMRLPIMARHKDFIKLRQYA